MAFYAFLTTTNPTPMCKGRKDGDPNAEMRALLSLELLDLYFSKPIEENGFGVVPTDA